MIEERTKKELISEKADKEALEKERKILNVLIPLLGIVCLILGTTGTVLTATATEMQVAVLVVYIIMAVFGVLGSLYLALVIIRKKNPNFLRKKVEEEVPPLSD